MKGDFSRNTFRPRLQYTRVLAQQGRVELDGDLNEAQSIQLKRLRMAIIDFNGPFGGPMHLYDADGDWGRANDGFKVSVDGDNGGVNDLTVGAGRYYVDGWVCASLAPTYSEEVKQLSPKIFPEKLLNETPFFVYLDVWERHITSLEDDYIREVALDGPDTSSRAQLVCQVRFLKTDDIPMGLPDMVNFNLHNISDWWPKIVMKLRGGDHGRLKVKALRPNDAGENPCLAGAEARYIGPENQFYRVEIHAVNGQGEATFKFSRNNGSDVAALLEIGGKFLTIAGIYEPQRGFSAGQWVELTDDERELLGQPGTLVQVIKVEGNQLTIDTTSANGTLDPNEFHTHPKVRRWDQTGKGPLTLEGGAIPVVEDGEDGWIPLEYGIQIQFEDGGGLHSYHSGDYWNFPARYLTGDVEWPNGTFLPPFGIKHYYAPLAVVKAYNDVVDLRVLKDRFN